jgi:molecular chaperone GrpE
MDEPLNNNEPHAPLEIEQLRKERDEYLSGWQRAKADFVNYKRDEAIRLQDAARYGSERLIGECIGILDNFELGLAAMEKQGPVEKGVYMIKAQIEDVLRRQGVEKIPIEIGKPMNPMYAEAIAEGESEMPPGSVIEEIE